MSFSVSTGVCTYDEFAEKANALADQLHETQYARAEATELINSVVARVLGLVLSGPLGRLDEGYWSLSISGHSNPGHTPDDHYTGSEFVGVTLNHLSKSDGDYILAQAAKPADPSLRS